MSEFQEKYGLWALVAGGSLGMGEAFSSYVVVQGNMDLLRQ